MDQEKVSEEKTHTIASFSATLADIVEKHKAGEPIIRRMAERILAREEKRGRA